MTTPPRPEPDPRQFLFVFDGDGEFLEQLLLPETPKHGGPEAGARRVVLAGAGEEWLMVAIDTRRMTGVHTPEQTDTLKQERRPWSVVVRPDGSEELWVVECKARRLLRYGLPE